jgi:hypothetical protein
VSKKSLYLSYIAYHGIFNHKKMNESGREFYSIYDVKRLFKKIRIIMKSENRKREIELAEATIYGTLNPRY